MDASIPTSESQQMAGSAGGETPRRNTTTTRSAATTMMMPPYRGPHKIGGDHGSSSTIQFAHRGYFKSEFLYYNDDRQTN